MGQFRRNLLFSLISGKKDSNYLTIEALEDGLTVCFTKEVLSYSLDGVNWEKLYYGSYTPVINTGQSLFFKGELSNLDGSYGTFIINNKCNLSGNCMSILYGDDYGNKTYAPEYAFRELFTECPIVEVSKNFLPATELGVGCYIDMFYNCSDLEIAPDLPANVISEHCYDSMFKNCMCLIESPKISATTLAPYCCSSMFHSCDSLRTAPELLATTLAEGCYQYMFYSCSSLTTAPELPATELVSECYYYLFYNCRNLNHIKAMFTTKPSSILTGSWVYNVSSTGTFVKNKDATWSVTGNNGIPSGWTIKTE